MEPKINEVEKALKYLAKEGPDAGKRAKEDIRRIGEWHDQSVFRIKAFKEVVASSCSERTGTIAKDTLHLTRLVYRHDLKRKMKRRRILQIALNLNSWAKSTRTLLSGMMARGEKFASVGDLQDTTGKLFPLFILRTPFYLDGQPVELLVKNRRDWILDAINRRDGYEIYGVEFYGDADPEKNHTVKD